MFSGVVHEKQKKAKSVDLFIKLDAVIVDKTLHRRSSGKVAFLVIY